MKRNRREFAALLVGAAAILSAASPALAAVHLTGRVEAGGGVVAHSQVTLWEASAAAPKMLAQAVAGSDGRFAIDSDQSIGDGAIVYLVAAGGAPSVGKAGGDNKALVFLSVLGGKPPAAAVVNEFTTVASVWTAAQFLDGSAIMGPPLALRIAAGNVHNFVDLGTGGWGEAIAGPLNSTLTPTMANFATLSDVLAGCATRVKADACDSLFAAAETPDGKMPADTLAAAKSIARAPWHNPEKVFALLEAFYPVPAGKPALRPAPFMPYLTFAPSAWVLPLKFAGGGFERRRQAHVRQPGQCLDRR